MTLEERIKQMLAESAAKREEKNTPAVEQIQLKSLTEADLDEMSEDEIAAVDTTQLDELSKELMQNYKVKAAKSADLAADNSTKMKRLAGTAKVVKKQFQAANEGSEVSSQVAALLEAEGLSEDFKLQAVTIFEAAVSDRVLQLTEELELQFENKLNEAKAEIEDNIDGFLNETVQRWATDNEVAIQNNFKTRLAESFMDGLRTLLVEHSIDLPEESENALDIALDQVNTLEESVESANATAQSLQEQVKELKAEKILESFKNKMTSTEFDRFEQLTESVAYVNDTQYAKQLSIVMENFGKQTARSTVKSVLSEQVTTETAATTIVTESNSAVNRYAAYMQSKVK